MSGVAGRGKRRPSSPRRRTRWKIDLRLPRPLKDMAARLPRPDPAKTLRDLRATLAAHPRRAAGFGVLGILLLVFVARSSLPLALAERSPGLAAFLAPDNAVVLSAQARRARAELNTLIAPPPAPDSEAATAATAPAATAPAVPGSTDNAAPEQAAEAEPSGAPLIEDGTDAAARDEKIAELRTQIADLADRILARAPLDAQAMRLKAEMESDPVVAEQDMRAAYARSRREPVAAFWLMNHSYEKRDFADVIQKADALLRTSPALSTYTLTYLYSLAADPEGREAVAKQLATSPPWRTAFFRKLGDFVNNDDAVALFIAMKEAGSPPLGTELGPYLNARLFKAKDAEGSYNTWLQLLSDEELARLLPVQNADFAQDPSGLPFDWSLGRGRNVTTRFVRLPGKTEERALRVHFGVGRVRFGGVLQVTFMRPGSYAFSGRQSGNMTSKRGMKWQVRCFPSNALAGESSQLFGSPRGWQDFRFTFTVPEQPGCSAQVIRLILDARSTSEEYASGEIAFAGIAVNPAPPEEQDDASSVRDPSAPGAGVQ